MMVGIELLSEKEQEILSLHQAGHITVIEQLYPNMLQNVFLDSKLNLVNLIANRVIPKPFTSEVNALQTCSFEETFGFFEDISCTAIDLAGELAVKTQFPSKAKSFAEDDEKSFETLFFLFYKSKGFGNAKAKLKKYLAKDKALTTFFVKEMLKENEKFLIMLWDAIYEKGNLTRADINNVKAECEINTKAAETFAGFMNSYVSDPCEYVKVRSSILGAK